MLVGIEEADNYQPAPTNLSPDEFGELVPAIGGQHQVIVAYAKDDAPLDTAGFGRIINPRDKSGARNVSNIIRIQVIDPPLPQQPEDQPANP